jgi:hypothetical protein
MWLAWFKQLKNSAHQLVSVVKAQTGQGASRLVFARRLPEPVKKQARLTGAKNIRSDRPVEVCVRGFESYPQLFRALMQTGTLCFGGAFEIELSKAHIKVVKRGEPLPQLAGQKERRIGLQAAEEAVKIVIASNFTLARLHADCG